MNTLCDINTKEWVDLKKQLPKINKLVVFYNFYSGWYEIGIYNPEIEYSDEEIPQGFETWRGGSFDFMPTHWTNLPDFI